MKKTIQLKESDLTRMIVEVINELDWKTYANAAGKRKEQGKDKNAHDLKLYAGKQFQKKHHLPDLTKPYGIVHNDYPMYDYSYITPYSASIYAGEISPAFAADNRRTTLNKRPNDEHPSILKNGGSWYNFNTETDETDYYKNCKIRNGHGIQRGYKDLDDYYNGNYEYQKGKGWTLKDKNESIIREAVNKTLRKYIR